MKNFYLLICVAYCYLPIFFCSAENLPTIENKTKEMKKMVGYFTIYNDEQAGKIWLEIDRWNAEFLYVQSLPAGLGSNDIGLDRGQLGRSRVVKFIRSGPKILMIQPNYRFRTQSNNTYERQSVDDAFAVSVIWGFRVSAQTDKRVLVDATAFYLSDAHDVSGRLKEAKQGSYTLDKSRSVFYQPMIRNFPKNTEVESLLTFTGKPEGNYIRDVTPSPENVTVRQHHSLVELPNADFVLRPFDPRAGFWPHTYYDYAAPMGESLVKRFIVRHRLKKKNPEADISEAVEPIVYYVDRGVPEDIRQVIFEGAGWWNQAFEAAGYKNAFQVKLLPEGADPMDLRYNVVQWVHRATRGWSYGASVRDPRTGEIIKGHVTLGSLRLRQDYLIAEGLIAPYETGKPITKAMREIAFARLRQLVAHEIGHTLGLSHNFAASVSERASVMDYPHPLFKLDDEGKLKWNDAYDKGIGQWDKTAIAYGYQDFPDNTDEKKALDAILQKSMDAGIAFISDPDARPQGGLHPHAHLWDNGNNAVDELNRVMQLRKHTIARFSEKNIPMGTPMSSLEDVFVPIYLMHRYQIEAAVKLVGGMYYTYALRGDGQKVTELVPPEVQQQAIQALVSAVNPQALAIPENIIQLIPPKAYGWYRGREHFKRRTGLSFDPLSAAETSADMVFSLLLHPDRAARMVEYQARNKGYPGFDDLCKILMNATWLSSTKDNKPMNNVVNNINCYTFLKHLMSLVANKQTPTTVKALAFDAIKYLKKHLKKVDSNHFYRYTLHKIRHFEENPEQYQIPRSLQPPAGSPIGMGCRFHH